MRIPVPIYVKIKFSVLDDIDNIKKKQVYFIFCFT